MGKARESHMIEFMIMMFIMIWVIQTRMKILLGQFWWERRGLILGAVELADLQQSQVCCSLKCYNTKLYVSVSHYS